MCIGALVRYTCGDVGLEWRENCHLSGCNTEALLRQVNKPEDSLFPCRTHGTPWQTAIQDIELTKAKISDDIAALSVQLTEVFAAFPEGTIGRQPVVQTAVVASDQGGVVTHRAATGHLNTAEESIIRLEENLQFKISRHSGTPPKLDFSRTDIQQSCRALIDGTKREFEKAREAISKDSKPA